MKMIKSLISPGVLLVGAMTAASSYAIEADERRARGEETLEKITGVAGKKVIDSLKDISPELGNWIIDFAYGDVFSDTSVSLCTRELATISWLTALGNAQPQLKVHIEEALNVGCRPAEIVTIITQMAVYSGFPGALNGISAAREVFEKRGIKMPATALEKNNSWDRFIPVSVWYGDESVLPRLLPGNSFGHKVADL